MTENVFNLVEEALRIGPVQKEAYLAGAPIDKARQFVDSLQVRALEELLKDGAKDKVESNILIALQFKFMNQIEALGAGATPEEALKFVNDFQVQAFKAGAPPEEALKFKYVAQVKALEAGAPTAEALRFEHITQVEAFKAGVPTAEALRFEHRTQVEAFKAGAPVVESPRTEDTQVEVFKAEATAEEALGFIEQLWAYILGSPLKDASEVKCSGEHCTAADEGGEL